MQKLTRSLWTWLTRERRSSDQIRMLLLGCLGYATFALFRTLCPPLRRGFYSILPKRALKHRYGDCWVVVTGASNGLGLAIAEAFAQKGFNLILLARSQAQLSQSAQQLQRKYGVQVRFKQFDFSSTDRLAYRTLVEQLYEWGDIGILINNVGMFKMDTFHLEQYAQEIISTNVVACTYLSQEFVARMRDRPCKSMLAFVGSETGEVVHAGYAIQAATKAYVGHLSRCLAKEMWDKIDVKLLTPGPIETELLLNSPYAATLPGSVFRSKASDVAESFLQQLSFNQHIIGTKRHGLMIYLEQNHECVWALMCWAYARK